MSVQTKRFLSQVRELNPHLIDKNDEDLYKYLNSRNEIPSYAKSKAMEAPSLKQGNVDPYGLPKNNINALAELADYGIDENSANWLKQAYNTSLTGLTEQLMTGKQRYDIDYDKWHPNVIEDIFSTVASFVMPLDFLAMGAGGVGGKLAQKGLQNYIQKKAGAELGKLGITTQVGLGVVRGAPPLAVYEGAIGNVAARIEGEDPYQATVDGVIHGGILGGLTGALGGGMAGKQAQIFKKSADTGVPLTGAKRFLTQYGLGMPGQVGAEATLFTGAETLEMVKANEKITSRKLLETWGKNIGLISVLKAQHRLSDKIIGETKATLGIGKADKYKRALKESNEFERRGEEVIDNLQESNRSEVDLKNVAREEYNRLTGENKSKVDNQREKLDKLDGIKKLFDSKDIELTGEKVQEFIIEARHAEKELNKIVNSDKSGITEQQYQTAKKLKKYWENVLKDLNQVKIQKEKTLKEDIPVFTEKKIREKFEEFGFDISAYEKEGVVDSKRASEAIRKYEYEVAEREGIKKTGGVKPFEEFFEGRLPMLKEGTEMKQKDYDIVKDTADKILGSKGKPSDKSILSQSERSTKMKLETPQNKKYIDKLPEELKVAVVDYVNRGTYGRDVQASTASAYVNAATKFVDFLKKRKRNIKTLQAGDALEWMKQEKFVEGVKHSENTGLAKFFQHLRDYNYIDSGRAKLLLEATSSIKTLQNESKGKKPAREGIRRKVKELIKKKDLKTQLAGELGSEYYLRSEEIAKLKSKDIKKYKNEYYLDLKKGTIKSKTLERNVWLKSDFAVKLKEYLDGGGKLSTTSLSSLMKPYSDNKMPFFDLRRRGHTLANQKLSEAEYRHYLYLQGHHKSRIEEFYNIDNISDIIRIQKSINKKLSIGGKVQRQVISISKAEPPASQIKLERAKERWEKTYPELKIEFVKDLGKYKGEKVLGQITGHLINVVEGKARPDTIPHEVSHHVVDVLQKFGGKTSKKIIADGLNKFKKAGDKSPQDAMERLVQSIADYSLQKPQTNMVKGRIRSFLNRAISHLKSIFGIQSKTDISRLLAYKLETGKIPKGKEVNQYINELSIRHQVEPKSEKVSKRKRDANVSAHEKETILKSQGMSQKEINDLRIDVFGKKKYKEKDVDVHELEMYNDRLETMMSGKGGIGRRISEINKEYQMTPIETKEILEGLGVRNGDVNNILSDKIVRIYKRMAQSHGQKTLTENRSVDEILDISKGKLPTIRGTMPLWYVLREYGGPSGVKLSNRINAFDFTQSAKYQGVGHEAIHNIKSILGGKSKHMWLMDKQRRQKYEKDFQLTDKEKDFVKALDVKNTPESQAKEIWNTLTNFYWNSLYKEAKRHNNRIEFESFKKDFDPKFVTDYFSRRLTKAAFENIVEAKNGKYIKSMVDSNLKKIATKKALDYVTKNNISKKRYDEIKEREFQKALNDKQLRLDIETDIFNILSHRHDKVTNRYLMERGPLLPEFLDVTDSRGNLKRIRTYEHKFDKVADPYVVSMSKYLATVSHFPEWTGVGGKYKIGSSKPELLGEKMLNSEFGIYAEEGVKALLGIGNKSDYLQSVTGPLSAIASLSAATGLSSPLSGIKNTLIGLPRASASFGFWRTVGGVRARFNPDIVSKARIQGALNYGAKNLQLGEKGVGMFTMEKLFKANLMTGSENINRIASMHAGLMCFRESIPILRGEGNTMFMPKVKKAEARRMMKDQWRLSEEQINYLEKGDLSKADKKGHNLEGIEKIVEHFSHVSSQGGTNVGNMPLWTNNKYIKPFTLFQRMAYATTFDSYINYVKPAVKHGNLAPIAKALFGHALGGAAMYTMYDKLFGTENPAELGTDLDRIVSYLWRGEFLGLLGEIINPYSKDRAVAVPLMEPVIARNLREGLDNFTSWRMKGKTGQQAIGDFVKKTVVVVNQGDRLWRKSKSEYYEDSKRMSTMVNEFYSQIGDPRTPYSQYPTTEFPKYFRMLREKMIFTSDKDEIAKEIYKVYNEIMRIEEKRSPNLTPLRRHKETIRRIESAINPLNPIKINSNKKGAIVTDLNRFKKWLIENKGKAYVKSITDSKSMKLEDLMNSNLKIMKSFEYKKRLAKSALRNRQYAKLYSAYYDRF